MFKKVLLLLSAVIISVFLTGVTNVYATIPTLKANCSNIQEIINSAPSGERVLVATATYRCGTSSIVIPSGKKIVLGSVGFEPPAGKDYITVEPGAQLEISAPEDHNFINNDPTKSVIHNSGLVYIYNGTYSARGNIINGPGTTYISGGYFSKGRFDGNVIIAGGKYGNYAENVSDHLAGGCSTNGTVVSCNELKLIDNSEREVIPETTPVGKTFNLRYNYPQVAEAYGIEMQSSDNSILEIAGSTLNGYTATARKQGICKFRLTARNQFKNMLMSILHEVYVYNLGFSINGNPSGDYLSAELKNYALSSASKSEIMRAVNKNEQVTIDLSSKQVAGPSQADLKLFRDSIRGEEKAVAYYDLTFQMLSNGTRFITSYSDLASHKLSVKVTVPRPDNLPKCAENVRILAQYLVDSMKRYDVTIDGNNISFNAEYFPSTIAIIYEGENEECKKEAASDAEQSDSENTHQSDSGRATQSKQDQGSLAGPIIILTVSIIGILSCIAASIIIYLKFIRKNKK